MITPTEADDETLQVAAIQMVSGPTLEPNLERAGQWIAEAAAAGAQLVALPEYFCLFGDREEDKVLAREVPGQGPAQAFLSDAAKRHGVWLVGGSVPLASPKPGRVYNACLVFGPDGRQRARYDEIHLFGFNRGGERFDESTTITPGTTPVVVDLEAGTPVARWRAGLSLCYDLRFPELFRALLPVDLILVPSSFTHRTGQSHWEPLLRARAIENQCYVLAPAQGGRHPNGRRTWGHSVLIDPWGEVLQERAEGEGVMLGKLSRRRITDLRAGLPALSHRVL